MNQYECYFTDFTGNMFRFYLDHAGNGTVPLDLRNYLFNRYNIIKHEFIPSLQFIYSECALNIVNYIESLHPDVIETVNSLYIIGPCYKEPQSTTIDYQVNVSGTPFYVGGPHFNERDIEPAFDTMRREIKEETWLSLHEPVHNYDLCFLRDTYLPQTNETTKLVIDAEDIDIYGAWAHQNSISDMTSEEISDMERRLIDYKGDRDFRNRFNQHKIALTVIGNLGTLYNFYGRDILQVQPSPHVEIRSNDFGVVLVPLRLVYNLSKKLLAI
jgi:hypothetical protein